MSRVIYIIRRGNLRWIWLSFIVIVLDQASKYLVQQELVPYQPKAINAFLNLLLSYNTGAAFSFLDNAGGWQQYFFIGLAVVIGIIIMFWLAKMPAIGSNWQACALSLILGGALGNLYDRITLGHVIDFIQVYYKTFYWPVFNLADTAISIGAGMLILSMLLPSKED